MIDSGSGPSLRTIFTGRRGWFLLALLLAEFGGAMQGIAYATVLPVVADDLDGFGLFGATLAAGSIAAVLMLSVTGAVLGRLRPASVLLIATIGYVAGAAMSVFAPTMTLVLAGTVVRGVASGLLAGFGVGAIGGLFDERERPRVFGLFALIWLLPSLVGPLLNAGLTEWVGWRWALAWPAVLVVAARMLMGRCVSTVPWQRRAEQLRAGSGLVVAGGLVLGAIGSSGSGPLAAVLLGAGGALGAAGIVGFVVRSAGGRGLARTVLAFTAVCAGFFGLYEMLSLTLVEGLQQSLTWAAVAVMGALAGWSLAGLRPRPAMHPDAVVLGAGLITLAGGALLLAVALASGPAAVAVVIGAATVAGVGMGLAYPVISSEPFDLPDSRSASATGALVAFGETAGTAWILMVGGGLYSVAHSSGSTPRTALTLVFGVLLAVCLLAVAAAALRRHAMPRATLRCP